MAYNIILFLHVQNFRRILEERYKMATQKEMILEEMQRVAANIADTTA